MLALLHAIPIRLKIGFATFCVLIFFIIINIQNNEDDIYYDIFVPIFFLNLPEDDLEKYEGRYTNIGLSQDLKNKFKEAIENANSTLSSHENDILVHMEPEQYILGEGGHYIFLIKKNRESFLLDISYDKILHPFLLRPVIRFENNIIYTAPAIGPNAVEALEFHDENLGKKLKYLTLLHKQEIRTKKDKINSFDYESPFLIDKIKARILGLWRTLYK